MGSGCSGQCCGEYRRLVRLQPVSTFRAVIFCILQVREPKSQADFGVQDSVTIKVPNADYMGRIRNDMSRNV